MADDEDDGVHRLEGTSEVQGGLIIKKKSTTTPSASTPRASLLGLDKLAASKREDKNRLMSFNQDDGDDIKKGDDSGSKGSRNYRVGNEETPTYTGGLSEEARERMVQRLQKYVFLCICTCHSARKLIAT